MFPIQLSRLIRLTIEPNIRLGDPTTSIASNKSGNNTLCCVTTKIAFFKGIADQETVIIRIMENENSEKTLHPQHAI